LSNGKPVRQPVPNPEVATTVAPGIVI